jgi:phosphonate transport system permease protein
MTPRSTSRRSGWIEWFGYLCAVTLVVQAWRYVSERTIWEFVSDAPAQAVDLISRMMPPDWAYLAELSRPIWDTLTIATFGTVLAVFVAVPMAFVAAKNTTPHPLLRSLALLGIVSSRSINSILWALLLVAVFGPGLLAGILAIAARSVGFVAKLLYEAVEEIDPAPLEAVLATGSGRAQVLVYGVVPQVLPAFAGISVFRWDINIREAAVVGLVGAGGIGLQLDACVSALEWSRVSVILAAILTLVVVSETVSARVRRAVT